jgi:Rrf2 family protein
LDYGVRALFELTSRRNSGPIHSREIARRQAIPEAYLHQLLAALARAGMVRGTRGPAGGHELTGDPATITLRQVYIALEGPDRRGHPHDDAAAGHATGAPVVHVTWHDLEQQTLEYLESVSLADLVARSRTVREVSDYAI